MLVDGASTDKQKIKTAIKSFYSKGRRYNRNEMNRLLNLIDELFKTNEAIPVIENLTAVDTIEYYQYIEQEHLKKLDNEDYDYRVPEENLECY